MPTNRNSNSNNYSQAQTVPTDPNESNNSKWREILSKMKENCYKAETSDEIKAMIKEYFRTHNYERAISSQSEFFATSSSCSNTGKGKIGIYRETGEVTIYEVPKEGSIKEIKSYNPIEHTPLYMKFNEDANALLVVGYGTIHIFSDYNNIQNKEVVTFHLDDLKSYADFSEEEEGYRSNFDISGNQEFVVAVSSNNRTMIVCNIKNQKKLKEISFMELDRTYSPEDLIGATPKECYFFSNSSKTAIFFKNGGIQIYDVFGTEVTKYKTIEAPKISGISIVNVNNLFMTKEANFATFRAVTEPSHAYMSRRDDNTRNRVQMRQSRKGGKLVMEATVVEAPKSKNLQPIPEEDEPSEVTRAKQSVNLQSIPRTTMSQSVRKLENQAMYTTTTRKVEPPHEINRGSVYYNDQRVQEPTQGGNNYYSMGNSRRPGLAEQTEIVVIVKVENDKLVLVQAIPDENNFKFVSISMTNDKKHLFLGVKKDEKAQKDLRSYIWQYYWDDKSKLFIQTLVKNLGIFEIKHMMVNETTEELTYIGERKLRVMKYNKQDPDKSQNLTKSLSLSNSENFSFIRVSGNFLTMCVFYLEQDEKRVDVYTRNKNLSYEKKGSFKLNSIITYRENGELIFEYTISEDGTKIGVASGYNTLLMLKKGEIFEERRIDSAKGYILEIEFLEEDSVVLGLLTKQIVIYLYDKQAQKYKLIQTLTGHSDWVSFICVSDDKKMIISSSAFEVKIWEKVKTGLEKALRRGEIDREVELFVNTQTIKTSGEAFIATITGDKDRIFLSSQNETIELIRAFDKTKYLRVDKEDLGGGTLNKISVDDRYFINQTYLEGIIEGDTPVKIMGISDTGLSTSYVFPRFSGYHSIKNTLHEILLFDKNPLHDKPNYILTLDLHPKHELKQNIVLSDIFEEMFSNRDFFIDKGSVEQLISYVSLPDKKITKEEGVDISSIGNNQFAINDLNNLYEIHGKMNLLYIAVMSRIPKVIELVLNVFGYMPFLYEEGFDPIDAAIEVNDGPSLRAISNYFEKEVNQGEFVGYINKERAFKALKCSSENFKKFVMKFIVSDIPDENLIDPIKEYPIEEGKDSFVIRTSSHHYASYLHKRLEERAYKKKKNDVDPIPIEIKTTKVKFNYKVLYPSCREALVALGELSDTMLVEDSQYLVKHIWNMNKKTIVLNTFMAWACYICFILHTVWLENSIYLAVPAIVLSINFLLYTLLMLFAQEDVMDRLLNADTICDLYQYLMIPIITVLQQQNKINDEQISINSWINTVILIGGYRSLHGLKVLDSVRYMIAIIMQAFIDMAGFAIVMIASFLFFGTVGINLMKTKGEMNWKFLNYLLQVNYYYEVSTGGWEAIEGYNYSQYLVWLFSGIFLNMVMMNILIAVINHTIEAYEGVKVLVDVKERLRMLTDMAHFYSYFSCFNFIKRWDVQKRVLICIITKKGEDENEVKERLEEIGQKLSSVEVGMFALNQKLGVNSGSPTTFHPVVTRPGGDVGFY